MRDDRRGIAAFLLVTQSGLALLAALGLNTYVRLSNAAAQLAIPELLAFGGALVLLLLAIGLLRRLALAAIVVYVWEALTMLGTAFSVLTSGGSSLLLTSGLSGLVLPAAIVYFVARPRASTADLKRGLTVGLLLATALIHLSLVPEHLAEDVRLGRLFLLDGLAFLAMAFLTARNVRWAKLPRAGLLIATILAYLLVVLRGQESVDDLGVATKLIELVALGLVLWPERVGALSVRWFAAGAALVGAIVFSGGLAWAATLRPAASGQSHSHAGATLIAEAAPTDQQKLAAANLVDDTRSGISRFQDVGVALADGYRPTTPPRAATVHYVNPKYAHSGVVDPQHPQALVYANTPSGSLLLGAMYMMPKAHQRPPDIGGSLTEWHTHNNLCFLLPGFAIDGLQSPFGTCPVGSINGPTPAMLHVWIVPNPGGPFSELTPAFVARVTRSNGD